MTDFDDTQCRDSGPGEHRGQLRRGRASRRRRVERTRTHHVVTSHTGSGLVGDPAADWSPLDHWLELEPRPARSLTAVDPRLVRVGALMVAVVLAVPIALAMRSESGEGLRADAVASTTTMPVLVSVTPAAAVAPTPPPATAPFAPETVKAASGDSGTSASGAAAVQRAKPACAGIYTVIPNDYWNRFPKSSGASVAKWLAANNATADTPLYVGDKLCIPVGANAPAPPPTTAAPTSTVPATQVPPPAQAPPPTQSPTPPSPPPPAAPMTAAPAVVPPPAAAASPPSVPPAVAHAPAVTAASDPATVEAMIREIWPDELEERALTIARRESHLNPSVHNWCCYGVFAIYFDMGRNFLPELGITRAEQLLDARTNILAAYKLYTLAGWSPWSQTDPGS